MLYIEYKFKNKSFFLVHKSALPRWQIDCCGLLSFFTRNEFIILSGECSNNFFVDKQQNKKKEEGWLELNTEEKLTLELRKLLNYSEKNILSEI